jgi:hypothetical protein
MTTAHSSQPVILFLSCNTLHAALTCRVSTFRKRTILCTIADLTTDARASRSRRAQGRGKMPCWMERPSDAYSILVWLTLSASDLSPSPVRSSPSSL